MYSEARDMLPEEKFGSLEMPGEINPIAEEEDTSDAPTVIMHREYRTEEVTEIDIFWPF